MFGVTDFTIKKIKEPAFSIILFIGIFLGYMVAGGDPVPDDQAGGILSQILSSPKGHTLLTSSFFAIGITLVMAVFTGATEIPRDIDTGMILLIITKPISKTEYLIGKYIGVLCLCSIIFTASQLTVFITHFLSTGKFYPIGLMCKQFYLLFAVLPLTALTVMVSCFLNDISSMIISVVYIVFSIAMSGIVILVSLLPKSISSSFEAYMLVFYYFFPDFIYYFQNSRIFGLVSLALLLYSLSITVIFLTIGANALNSRDLNSSKD
jgi:ABC-type transport system involved in multi-copper enzyme maturation permease subunit